MNFLELRKQFYKGVCFSTNQVKSFFPGFNSNNLMRWTDKKLLVKLRNGFYSFPEYRTEPGVQFYLSNRIYRPSYVSLHTALAFYGIIPEAIVQVTCVTSLKTGIIRNDFGEFSYKSVSPSLMFGYEKKEFLKHLTFNFAYPEKAILDLLYLYPFYNNKKEMSGLRFDDDVLNEIIDGERLGSFEEEFGTKSVSKRLKLLREVYGL